MPLPTTATLQFLAVSSPSCIGAQVKETVAVSVDKVVHAGRPEGSTPPHKYQSPPVYMAPPCQSAHPYQKTIDQIDQTDLQRGLQYVPGVLANASTTTTTSQPSKLTSYTDLQ